MLRTSHTDRKSNPSVRPVRFSLGPHVLGSWFHHPCPRALRYAIDPARPAPLAPTAAERVRLEAGRAWETRACALLGARLIAPPGTASVGGSRSAVEGSNSAGGGACGEPKPTCVEPVFSVAESRVLLQSARPGQVLYQLTLPGLPDLGLLLPESGLQLAPLPSRHRVGVRLPRNHPDLVEVLEGPSGGRLLRVIELKHSAQVQPAHRVQLLVYALQLARWLADVPDLQVDTEHAAVWLADSPAPTPCDIGRARPHLERLLGHTLPLLLPLPPDQTEARPDARCLRCPQRAACLLQLQQSGSLALLGRDGIGQVSRRGGADAARPHQDLWQLYRDRDARAQLPARSQLRLEALLTQRRPRCRIHLPLPAPHPDEEVLLLVLERDPAERGWAALGWRRLRGGRRARQVRPHSRGPLARSEGAQSLRSVPETAGDAPSPADRLWLAREHDDPILLPFLAALGAELARTDARLWLLLDRDHGDLDALAEDALAQPEHAVPVLRALAHPALLRLRSPADPEEEQRIFILMNIFSSLIPLTDPFPWTLPRLHARLFGLPPEGLHSPHPSLDRVGCQQRLDRAEALLRWLRAAPGLRPAPARPRLPPPPPALWGLTAQLRAGLALEQRESIAALRRERCAPWAPGLWPPGLRLVSEHGPDGLRFRRIQPERPAPPAEDFPDWLLVRADERGLAALARYPDRQTAASLRDFAPSSGAAEVSVVARSSDHLLLRASGGRRLHIRPGARFVLLPRFSDFLGPLARRVLEQEAQRPCLLLHTLERAGVEASGERAGVEASGEQAVDASGEQAIEAGGEQAGWEQAGGEQAVEAEDQRSFWRRAGVERLLGLWGPPGSGKTTLLARWIAARCGAAARAGRRFHVLLTALSHAAIEHLLAAVAAVQGTGHDAGGRAALIRVGSWRGQARGPVCTRRGLPRLLERHPIGVVGATCQQLGRLPRTLGVDLVVIDEASQLPLVQALLAARHIPLEGRSQLILAGDHEQLPPIRRARAPLSASDPRRSAFAWLAARLPRHLVPLHGSYRLSPTLARLHGALVYGPDFHSRRPPPAALPSPPPPRDRLETWVDRLLGSGRGLRLIALTHDGQDETDLAEHEARLAAALADRIRARRPELEDDEFARSGLALIAPHRRHLERLTDALGPAAWAPTPLTVDRIQGQEADSCLFSLGVCASDLRRQARFLYLRARWLVALTRGRDLAVLLCSAAVLRGHPELLDGDGAEAGFAWLKGLQAELRAEGSVDLPAGVLGSAPLRAWVWGSAPPSQKVWGSAPPSQKARGSAPAHPSRRSSPATRSPARPAAPPAPVWGEPASAAPVNGSAAAPPPAPAGARDPRDVDEAVAAVDPHPARRPPGPESASTPPA